MREEDGIARRVAAAEDVEVVLCERYDADEPAEGVAVAEVEWAADFLRGVEMAM